MATIHDLGWWYWLVTVGLLGAGLLGWPLGVYLAMALCAVQIGHVIWLTGCLTAFPMQVRVTYLALLAMGRCTGSTGCNWPERRRGCWPITIKERRTPCYL